MALTNCPECGKEVSSTAESCPNCGYGVKKHFDAIQNAAKKEETVQQINKFNNKYGKALKIILPICVIAIVAIIIVSVLFSPQKIEYLGIYDTSSEQSINIGDDKEKIDSILGTPKKNMNLYKYGKYVTITYDNNNKADTILLLYFTARNNDLDRFIFADDIGYDSTEQDFISKYKYVYKVHNCDTLSVFLKKVKNGYVVINKDAAIKLYNEAMENHEKHNLYTVFFEPTSFDTAITDNLAISIDETFFDPDVNYEEFFIKVK